MEASTFFKRYNTSWRSLSSFLKSICWTWTCKNKICGTKHDLLLHENHVYFSQRYIVWAILVSITHLLTTLSNLMSVVWTNKRTPFYVWIRSKNKWNDCLVKVHRRTVFYKSCAFLCPMNFNWPIISHQTPELQRFCHISVIKRIDFCSL